MKKRTLIAGAGGIVVFLFLLVLLHPEVLCWIWGFRLREIDVRSGQIRERSYAFGLMVRERDIVTPFAERAREFSLVRSPPLWEPAWGGAVGLARSVGSKYISHRYGFAASDCASLVRVHEYNEIPPDTRREDIRNALRFMEEGKLEDLELLYEKRNLENSAAN